MTKYQLVLFCVCSSVFDVVYIKRQVKSFTYFKINVPEVTQILYSQILPSSGI
jgi:hypothetical protein